MGFNPLDIIAPGLDAVSGVINAKQARDAFKSRYQDTVKDMKKAGLNPALAYGQGGGNPTTHDIPELGRSLTGAVGTAASAGQAKANMELTQAQTKLLNAQSADLALKPGLENTLLSEDINKRRQDVGLTKADISLRAQQQGLVGAQTAVEQKRLDQMDLAISQATLDQAWQTSTWQTRLDLLAKELTKAGVDITTGNLTNAALRAGLPKKELEGAAATGAQTFIKKARDAFRTPEDIGQGIQDDINRIVHWWNQHSKRK
ncbi:MAG: DNA pilot protein [Microvirus sp.]|nr:MAG: DNA pilot protein [Microvirus sp.]